jgi:hypothetical protein
MTGVDSQGLAADHGGMGAVSPLPRTGTVLPDATRFGRSLRVSWHKDRSLMVISVWQSDTCVATFHVAATDIAALTGALLEGPLDDLPAVLMPSGQI